MANTKQLLVEGVDDLYAIAQLMGHHTEWPDDKRLAPVHIKPLGGAEKILHENGVPLYLTTAAITTLGVILDADDKLHSRWQWLREHCGGWAPTMDKNPPAGGFIGENIAEGKRFGVWIMPDNVNSGMLETFAHFLVPANQQVLWNYAKEAFCVAKTHKGAPCGDVHKDKAEIYTWLAWQEPPCNNLGNALIQKMLDPYCQYAASFVQWFLRLYQLSSNTENQQYP